MKTFNQFINESQAEIETLRYLKSVGLLSDKELAKELFRLVPVQLGIAEIEWSVDWGWAAAREAEELEELMMDWFAEDDRLEVPLPEGAFIVPGSINSDRWDESEFWEEEDEDGAREQIYGFSPTARVKVAFLAGVEVAALEAWADAYVDRVFEQSSVAIVQEPKV